MFFADPSVDGDGGTQDLGYANSDGTRNAAYDDRFDRSYVRDKIDRQIAAHTALGKTTHAAVAFLLEDLVEAITNPTPTNLAMAVVGFTPFGKGWKSVVRAKAIAQYNNTGLTVAARNLSKKIDRGSSSFGQSPVRGNISERNKQAEDGLNSILDDPNSTVSSLQTRTGREVIDVTAPNGQSARFDGRDGSFIGFREP